MLLLSHSVVSDPLQPHGLQHTRFSCPSQSPRVCSKLTSIESVMPCSRRILCCPLLLPSVFSSITEEYLVLKPNTNHGLNLSSISLSCQLEQWGSSHPVDRGFRLANSPARQSSPGADAGVGNGGGSQDGCLTPSGGISPSGIQLRQWLVVVFLSPACILADFSERNALRFI